MMNHTKNTMLNETSMSWRVNAKYSLDRVRVLHVAGRGLAHATITKPMILDFADVLPYL